MEKILLSEGEYTVQLEKGEKFYWGASFFRKDGLKILHIPEGTEELADDCLKYCTELETLYLPKSLTKLGDQIFYGTYHSINIYYAGTSEEFKELCAPKRVIKRYQVPSNSYDVQPYCISDGNCYEEREESSFFANFCYECHVICTDGVTLDYGYKGASTKS